MPEDQLDKPENKICKDDDSEEYHFENKKESKEKTEDELKLKPVNGHNKHLVEFGKN